MSSEVTCPLKIFVKCKNESGETAWGVYPCGRHVLGGVIYGWCLAADYRQPLLAAQLALDPPPSPLYDPTEANLNRVEDPDARHQKDMQAESRAFLSELEQTISMGALPDELYELSDRGWDRITPVDVMTIGLCQVAAMS